MLQRKRSGAISCQRCGGLVDVNATRCPSCRAYRPGLWGYGPLLLEVKKLPFREVLIGFCAALYAGSLLLFRPHVVENVPVMDLLAPTYNALSALGATGLEQVLGWGRVETLFTAMFLHSNLVHLLFNCVGIWILAPAMQENYDAPRFLLVFILAGVAGNVTECLIDLVRWNGLIVPGTILIGASGGVCGLLGALVIYGYKRGGTFGSRVLRFGLLWAGIGLGLSLIIPRIALWAHVGGFVGGAAAGAALGFQEWRRSGPWMCLAAVVAGACVIAAFFIYLGLPPAALEERLQR
jgi:rhomboid protease GluP